jgi:glycerophosphoryl diester phosphodiesterase
MGRASTPLVIGHRGSPGYRPEHTESSYQLALAQGAEALEPDVVVTKDGVLVVRHENEISGTTDVAEHPEFADRKTTKTVDGERHTGWFTEDFTWDELATLRCRERLAKLRPQNTQFDGQEPILRLAEVLALIADHDSDVLAVIELKHATYFRELGLNLAAMLRTELEASGWDARPGQLVIESFELGVLDDLKQLGVRAEYVFLMESTGTPADEIAARGSAATPYAQYRTDDGLAALVGRVDGISVAKAELFERDALGRTTGTSDLVARAHAHGLTVFTWTLRPENHFLNIRFRSSLRSADIGDWRAEFALALQSGVDGIFVDHVDLGIQARDAFMSAGGPTLER